MFDELINPAGYTKMSAENLERSWVRRLDLWGGGGEGVK